ncbi:uncharacterized protein G2W53_000970 [Senna tora]|uniref:Uncharacterized protein n=1 Tax=Senna tora TaxID=362788 RepID=A0A835CL29_9FABA|nr:uncharacterized protein G2W53_000970 [Senna tora]
MWWLGFGLVVAMEYKKETSCPRGGSKFFLKYFEVPLRQLSGSCIAIARKPDDSHELAVVIIGSEQLKKEILNTTQV